MPIVVGLVAGTIALSSVASAAATSALITGKQIKDHTITSTDVALNTITGANVKDKSLTSADFASGTLLRGATGPQGPQGSTGPQGPPSAAGYVATLASGQTDVGDFLILQSVIAQGAQGGAVKAGTAVSYPFPLNFVPTRVYVGPAGTLDANCPGSGQAAAGYLCIYGLYDDANDGPVYSLSTDTTDTKFGFQMWTDSPNTATPHTVDIEGTWAVTAP